MSNTNDSTTQLEEAEESPEAHAGGLASAPDHPLHGGTRSTQAGNATTSDLSFSRPKTDTTENTLVQYKTDKAASNPAFSPENSAPQRNIDSTSTAVGLDMRNTVISNNDSIPVGNKKRLQHIPPRIIPSITMATENSVGTESSMIDPAVVLTGEVVDATAQDEFAMMATELADLQARLQEREGQQIVEATPVMSGDNKGQANNAPTATNIRQWRQTWILLVLIAIGGIVAVLVVLTSPSSSGRGSSIVAPGASVTDAPSPTSPPTGIVQPSTMNRTELPTWNPSETPSNLPSVIPSQSPTNSPRTILLSHLLSSTDFNTTEEWDSHLLANPESAQTQAINWLLNSDEWYSLQLTQTDIVLQQILQERYAMVVLYFATSGRRWSILENYYLNTTSSVCTWNADTLSYREGIYCDSPEGLVQEIALIDCMLVGSFPSEISLLQNLETLNLATNLFSGTLPSQLGELPLKYMSLENNELSGTLPSELGLLDQLMHLDFSANDGINSTIPSEFGLLSKLTFMDFSDSYGIQGPLPSELGNLENLAELFVYVNGGTLPTELGKLRNLSELDLSYGASIPTEFGLMSSLTILSLDVGGTIPTELGNLSNMVRLYLYYNGHSGTIPTELGLMTQMTYLELDYNQLTGTLPSEIGNLVLLDTAGFSGNPLTGTVPIEYGNLTNLTWITFLDTPGLTGNLDPVFCDGNDNPPIIQTHCLYDEVYSQMECSCCRVYHC